jgi:translocation and assembly module TamB
MPGSEQEPMPRPETEVDETRTVGRTWGQRARSRALKSVAAIFIGLVVLVTALILGLNTGPGHRFVADTIGGLEFENGMQISVGRIEGDLYGEMTLHDLSVRDPQGEFLFSPEIRVDWRPFAYLNGHVDVRSATAQTMILRRAPEFKETPPSEGPLLPDLDIDVGRLAVGRFVFEKAVTGDEQRVGSINGRVHIADGEAQVYARGGTVAIGEGAGGDRFNLKLDAVPESNKLDIDLFLQAPADGVIASLAGLDDPLTVRAAGRGDWAAWNGRLDANMAGTEFARLAVTARDGTIAVKGQTRIARLFEGATAQLLGPVMSLDMSAVLGERSVDLSGRVSSDAFVLTPDGRIDLSDNTFSDFQLGFALLRPSAIAPGLAGSGVKALLKLDGEFATPTVEYRIDAARAAMNDMGIEGLTASGKATVNSDRILIPVSATVRRVTGLDTVAGGKLENVRLTGDVAIQGTRILSDNMRLRSDRLDAQLLLVADISSGLYTGAVNGRIDDYRLESVGIFNIRTDMDLKSEAGGFAITGQVSARSTRLLNESLQSYLGGNFVASTDLRYSPEGIVTFRNLRLVAPDLSVRGGSGSWSPDGQISLVADGASRRYGAISVRVKGTIEDPDAYVTAERPDLGIGLANLEARVTGAPGGYRLNLTSDTDYGPLGADVVLGTGDMLSLQINSANLAGVDFAGRLEQTRAGPFAGKLTAQGNGIGGVLDLAGERQYQAVAFNLRANDAQFPGPANLSIGRAIIDGRAVLYDQPQVTLDAQLGQTRYGSFAITAARALVDYRGGRGHAKAIVEGSTDMPFRLAANVQMQPGLWRASLNGRMRGQTVRTLSPARITIENGTYELMPTALAIGGGKIRAAGSYGSGIELETRMEGVNMAIVNDFLPGLGLGGTINGSLDFAQATPAAFPRADARLQLNGFTRTTATAVSQPVDVNVIGKLLADGGEARAVIRRRGTVIGRVAASLRPLPPGEGSWTTRLLEAPLGGGIRFNGPAETLFSFAGLSDQRLTGPMGVAADFSCRVSSPCLRGVVRGQGLRYEHLTLGTQLTDMTVSGRFDGDRLELEQLEAKAGEGSLAARGSVSLAADAGYPMNLSVNLREAQLARSDALAATATGDLRLTKSAGETALLSGQIRLPEARYQIVREGAAEVPSLTGVRFKPPRGAQRITGDEEAPSMSSAFALVRLDLRLRAPEKLYVSGMGLESEWSADFRISGTSRQPSLAGEVNLVRGTLGFAGRSFELTEGNVQFNGGNTIDPSVAITATEEIEDVTVNVNVSGRAMDPQIAFSSTPGLPQDEIVSRILFGSSVANLSAIQAVQLASSLNSLRGSGGGLNPLGKLRAATGVDRLRIVGGDEDTGRGTSLAAGKYLTDDIYVELITDARGFTATQLEVSITNWLSLLSQAGGSGVNAVNVRIKKDY